jgi:hypothetical protein
MQTLKTGTPSRNVLMGVITPNESRVWIIINSDVLQRDSVGKPNLVLTTFSNVTDQVKESRYHQETLARYSEAQKKAQQDQDLMMSALKFGIWKWDTRISTWSWRRILWKNRTTTSENERSMEILFPGNRYSW